MIQNKNSGIRSETFQSVLNTYQTILSVWNDLAIQEQILIFLAKFRIAKV
jgi:hypothetical protein